MGNKTMKAVKGIFFVYLAAMLIMCLVGALVPAKDNTWERGATIYYPDSGAVVGQDFKVNGSVYSKEEIKSAELLFEPSEYSIPIEREKIVYDGETLLTLSTFKNAVSVPEDGDYRISVKIITDAEEMIIDTVDITVKDGTISKAFEMFSFDHIAALVVLCLIFAAMMLVYKKHPTEKTRITLFTIASASIILCDIILKIWMLNKGVFRGSYDMILHMCDISGFLAPVLLFMVSSKGRNKLYNMMFIWGLGGAVMALLTPEMGGYAFPSFYFFNFFLKHGMIVIGLLLVTFIDGLRPKLKELPIVMLISLGMVGVIYIINKLIVNIPPYEPGNYMFLSYPPTGGSAIDILVDIFGPAPMYIIGMAILAVIVFLVFWAPFAIEGSIKRAVEKKRK